MISSGLVLSGGWATKRFLIPSLPKPDPSAPTRFPSFVFPAEQTITGIYQRHSTDGVDNYSVLDEQSGKRYMLTGGFISYLVEAKLVRLKNWLEPGVRVTIRGHLSDEPEVKNRGPVFKLTDLDLHWQTVSGVIQPTAGGKAVIKVNGSEQDLVLDLSRLTPEEREVLECELAPGAKVNVFGLFGKNMDASQSEADRFFVRGILPDELPEKSE